ncbi:MAG: carbohydrate ABC transporter permease [Deinococcales bacterium]|nr:carbohydrate ABC transporter permease [Deinococcales bacterium]
MRPRNAWLTHALLIVACFVVMAPVLFALIKATQSYSDVLSPSLVPGRELLDNISAAWTNARLAIFMRNSLFVAAVVTLGKTLTALLAGLALVYFEFRGKRVIFTLILLTLMMPTEVLIVPLFDLIAQQPPASWAAVWEWLRNPADVVLRPLPFGFGWSNTFLALTVPFLASATGIFLFRQHFMSVPRELADAAKIDGAGPLRFLWRILVPMSANTIGALAVIQFVYVWDQYLWPRVIIRREELQVVQVGLNLIIGTGDGVQWGYVMAGALLTIVPPLLVFMLLQEQFMRGFALSQSK